MSVAFLSAGVSDAFIPQIRGSPSSASATNQVHPVQHAEAVSSGWQGVSQLSAALTTATAAVTLAVGLRRRGIRRSQQKKCQALRRELSVAYEDSGIELLDNGKFAQGLIGAEGAWGRYEFDPAGFSRFTEFVPFYREAELKHGRIAMLAWVGLVVPDFLRVPGERTSFENIPLACDAHERLAGITGVNVQILFWATLVEFCCAKKVFEWNSLECAGDYGLGVQFLPKDEEGQKRVRLAEIKNGRLAMIAFGGALTQEVITRHPFPWLF
uniref:Chlorophyll light harvesting complex protein n=1 Tax=Polykrikos lebourae TaxID=370573 RepID=A0A0K0TN03_9DINO|nr:chlorophyll light harvesting complex protein [Polykrikos lebourae]